MLSPDSSQSDPIVGLDHFSSINSMSSLLEKEVVYFLFKHLEKYGDPEDHIRKAVQYACDADPSKGGLVVTGRVNTALVGAVVINKTGMSDYIPENILVYIAVDGSTRGMGIGKTLMTKAIELSAGSIALHVEPDNPAKRLYERLGFTNKYLEMRYQK